MTRAERIAPWLTRAALTGATFVFAMVGLRYVLNPVSASAETGVQLSSALASTATRVGFGAFPLGVAIFTLTCLISARRRLAGLSLVAIVVGTAIVVRIAASVADGPVPQSMRLFIPEAAMFTLAVSGLALEKR